MDDTTMTTPRLPLLLRPYIAHEMPGWGRLFRALRIGGIDNQNPRWRDANTILTFGKLHGYKMELDLSDDLERATFFVGRYYDLENQLILDALLKPGDTFLDIGANIGMATLHGARRVGKAGRVIAFEPQPGCYDKIKRNIELNGIDHVQCHNVALGELNTELRLKVLGGGTILACFCRDDHDVKAREEIPVPVRRGDELVHGQIVGDLVIKIDVEGYELFALRGLSETIETYHPPIISEANARHLRRAGTDEHEYFDFLNALGYQAYQILSRKRAPFGKQSFRLLPIRQLSEHHKYEAEADILWLWRSYPILQANIEAQQESPAGPNDEAAI
jgi:FkbM family methyltransferase